VQKFQGVLQKVTADEPSCRFKMAATQNTYENPSFHSDLVRKELWAMPIVFGWFCLFLAATISSRRNDQLEWRERHGH
jgi:hypothetical protein